MSRKIPKPNTQPYPEKSRTEVSKTPNHIRKKTPKVSETPKTLKGHNPPQSLLNRIPKTMTRRQKIPRSIVILAWAVIGGSILAPRVTAFTASSKPD